MYSSLHLRTAWSGHYPEFGGRSLLGGGALMYSMKGKTIPCQSYGVNPLLGGSAIGGSTVFLGLE